MYFVLTAWLVCTGQTVVSSPLPAPGDDPPGAAGKRYVLRVVSSGDQYQAVRFKPATGESWQLLSGQWEKLADAAPVPAGDYDVVVIPAKSLVAVRFDRASGAAWLVRGGKWMAVGEPRPEKDAAKPGRGYAVRHIRVGDQLHLVRFHQTTGAAWHVSRGRFEPLAESGPIAAGDYEITMIAGEDNWMAFRIDRQSGKTWLLQANKWELAEEP